MNCIFVRGEQECSRHPFLIDTSVLLIAVNQISVSQIFTSNVTVPVFATEFRTCVTQVCSGKFCLNKKVSVRLPKELDVKSDNTIVFCMLTWSRQNEVRNSSSLYYAHTYIWDTGSRIFTHHWSLRLQSKHRQRILTCICNTQTHTLACFSTGHKWW